MVSQERIIGLRYAWRFDDQLCYPALSFDCMTSWFADIMKSASVAFSGAKVNGSVQDGFKGG